MFKSIKIEALLFLTIIAVFGVSCKKNNVTPVTQQIKLTNDTITQNGLTLLFINKDTTFQLTGDSSRKQYERTFFIVYPKICAYFNPGGPRKVTFIIDPTYKAGPNDDVAGIDSLTATVTFSPISVLQNPADLNIVTHEVTRIDQQYLTANYTPQWLIEGLADYSKAKFGIPGAYGTWYIPDYNESDNYTDGYTTIARFLMWAEAKYHPGIAQAVAQALRAGTYADDATWLGLTGFTFPQLWNSYTENPYF